MLEHTLLNLDHLLRERGGERSVCGLVIALPLSMGTLNSVRAFFNELVKFSMHILILRALAPGVEPVNVGVRSRGSADNLKHPFRGIGILGARKATIALEILDKCGCILANVAEVDSLTPLLKEEQALESLEQHC